MPQFNPRDITWLGFNARVLQEAMDETVPLHLRIRFLGIFSNNLDEFFRVRVAGLKRALELKDKLAVETFFDKPQRILDKINKIVIKQQEDFEKTWDKIQEEMAEQKVFIKTPKKLTEKQKEFVKKYFDEEVESNVIPILLHDHVQLPYLREKSLYLGIAMRRKDWKFGTKFAIIEVPAKANGRFVILPTEKPEETDIMLLEDVIAFNLPHIFSYFGYDDFKANSFKVTKDAEFDLDNDIRTSFVEKIEKGIKSRRKGKPTRFVFDKDMDKSLVEFLIKKLNLTKRDSIIPGQKIHNFRHFMDFPDVFKNYEKPIERSSFTHPEFDHEGRITDVIVKKDVLLTFPYHTFTPVIDLLREAAMDPDVKSIQITAYRLASNSKIVNALINAVRNRMDRELYDVYKTFRYPGTIYKMDRNEMKDNNYKLILKINNMKEYKKLFGNKNDTLEKFYTKIAMPIDSTEVPAFVRTFVSVDTFISLFDSLLAPILNETGMVFVRTGTDRRVGTNIKNYF
jgi:polyphosphate kinase